MLISQMAVIFVYGNWRKVAHFWCALCISPWYRMELFTQNVLSGSQSCHWKLRSFFCIYIRVSLTIDNLAKLNRQGNTKCNFCSSLETIQHLVFNCHLAKLFVVVGADGTLRVKFKIYLKSEVFQVSESTSPQAKSEPEPQTRKPEIHMYPPCCLP